MFETNIQFYSIMILLSLFVNVLIVLFTYKKFNFTKDEIIGALVYENIGIITGAKLLTFFENYKQYNEFNFLNTGFSSLGGIIGAIICLIIFAIQFKKNYKDLLFIFMPSIPLMYAIGKIGCFIVGCCYGIQYNGLGNVVYNYSKEAPIGIHLFPIQILETIVFILIFIFIIIKITKKEFNWKTLGINFILCGLAKFILDFFRMSHVGKIITTNQILCLLFIGIGIILFFKENKKFNL